MDIQSIQAKRGAIPHRILHDDNQRTDTHLKEQQPINQFVAGLIPGLIPSLIRIIVYLNDWIVSLGGKAVNV